MLLLIFMLTLKRIFSFCLDLVSVSVSDSFDYIDNQILYIYIYIYIYFSNDFITYMIHMLIY